MDTGVQVLTTDAKAARLVRDGTYKPVPDAAQPSPEESAAYERAVAEAKAALRRPGRTNIAAAIADAVPEERYA